MVSTEHGGYFQDWIDAYLANSLVYCYMDFKKSDSKVSKCSN